MSAPKRCSIQEKLAMLKKHTVVLTALVCSVLVFVLPIAAQNNEELKIRYDRFKDETRVGISLGEHKAGWEDSITHVIAAIHPGQQKPHDSSKVFWMISAPRIPRYGKTELILLVDKDRIKFDGAIAGSGDSRFAAMTINLDVLRRISKAKVVEGQVAGVEFKLEPEDQKKIVTLVQYFAADSVK